MSSKLFLTIVSLIAAVSFAKGEVSIRAGGCKGNTCIGKLKTRFHGITGDVYLEDDTTICIKGFYFDGQGINPDISVSTKGAKRGRFPKLGRIILGLLNVVQPGEVTDYNFVNLEVKLPKVDGVQVTTDQLSWISVYCGAFSISFGDLNLSYQSDANLITAFEQCTL